MQFLKKHILKFVIAFVIVSVLVNTLGPIVFSLGDWSNYIQWISGYGIPFGAAAFVLHALKVHARLEHLHHKVDKQRGESK